MNNLSIAKIRDCYSDLVSIVVTPTHGRKVLDVLITDLHCHYDKAVVLPPIQQDVPGHGRPSDHGVAIARPVADKSRRSGFSRVVQWTRRVVTTTNLIALGLFLACFNWQIL